MEASCVQLAGTYVRLQGLKKRPRSPAAPGPAAEEDEPSMFGEQGFDSGDDLEEGEVIIELDPVAQQENLADPDRLVPILWRFYVDGSYRDEAKWPRALSMSAGGFCTCSSSSHAAIADSLGFAVLVLVQDSRMPYDSTHAELRAIQAGCSRVLQAAQAGQLDRGRQHVMEFYSDCSSVVDVLSGSGSIHERFWPLVDDILLLLSQLSAYVEPQIYWVAGHQKTASEHKEGNDEADKRSKAAALTDVICFAEHKRSSRSRPITDPSDEEVERHLCQLLEVAAVLHSDPRKKAKLAVPTAV